MAVHKRRLQLGEGEGCLMSSATVFGQGGSLGAMSALFGAKFGYFDIYSVSAQTRKEGVKPELTFCRQGQFFTTLCRVFYGRP